VRLLIPSVPGEGTTQSFAASVRFWPNAVVDDVAVGVYDPKDVMTWILLLGRCLLLCLRASKIEAGVVSRRLLAPIESDGKREGGVCRCPKQSKQIRRSVPWSAADYSTGMEDLGCMGRDVKTERRTKLCCQRREARKDPHFYRRVLTNHSMPILSTTQSQEFSDRVSRQPRFPTKFPYGKIPLPGFPTKFFPYLISLREKFPYLISRPNFFPTTFPDLFPEVSRPRKISLPAFPTKNNFPTCT